MVGSISWIVLAIFLDVAQDRLDIINKKLTPSSRDYVYFRALVAEHAGKPLGVVCCGAQLESEGIAAQASRLVFRP
jgi:hypothetical protein